MSFSVVILAAGQGTRMRSACAKVLHPVADRSMLAHVITAATALHPQETVVVVHPSFDSTAFSSPTPIQWAHQSERLGTGHALLQAMPFLSESTDRVLLLCGDVPLIQTSTLRALLNTTPDSLAFITNIAEKPKGLGRVVRDAQHQVVVRIVEEKDATEREKSITEVNAGIYVFPRAKLQAWLTRLAPNNAQNEFYLTDVIAFALEEGVLVETVQASKDEVLGVNDRMQLQEAERLYQRRAIEALCAKGVSVKDINRLDIRGNVHIAQDVVLDINVILEGDVEIGEACYIGAGAIIKNSRLGKGVKVNPYSVIDGAVIQDACEIGPFARIRLGSVLEHQVKVGNFVEVKHSNLNTGTKANHLAYLGDAEIGANVNVGAGAITCNYDGAKKHQTIIGDGAFIGSNVELVAPVRVGKNATIGAGTTLTRDVPEGSLTVRRATQKTVLDWQKPKKDEE